jgi:SAM-dependent methyltransferase
MAKEHSLRSQFWQRIRAAHYAFDLSHLPFGEKLARKVSEWEIAHGFGDSPKAKERWDAQFSTGEWNYMRELRESARYAAIINYLTQLKPGGAILDMGCAEGVLYERFRPYGYARYVGVDISDVAIQKLTHFCNETTVFEQGDGDTYAPSESFDAIVFNETLYYLREPVPALRRYTSSLRTDGVFIISTYTASRRSLSLLREAKRSFAVKDETEVRQGSMSWLCTVLTP